MTTLPDVTILKQILAFMMRIFVSLFVIKNFLLRALFSFNTLSFSYKTMYNIIRRSHSISTFDRSNSVVKQLHDRYNRNHDYLRISLTERCNLRCTYCMPEEGIKLGERDNNLSLEELKRISRFFVTSCGVNKIRLTGGEPTVDKKLVPMLEYLNGLRKDGLNRLALTTNGLTLSKQCCRFKELGTLDRRLILIISLNLMLIKKTYLSTDQGRLEYDQHQLGHLESGQVRNDNSAERLEHGLQRAHGRC